MMKLATIRTAAGTKAVRVEVDVAIELGSADIGEFLHRPDWKTDAVRADGPRHETANLDYAPLILNPEKIFCVGLNYRSHILEMGREVPKHPTLFAKFARSLVGAYDSV